MPIPRKSRRPSGHDRDWWDKASIVSGFTSSVVIALIGIRISYSIQSAQILSAKSNSDAQVAIARIKADNDKKLQEGQLTAQLVQHLVSKEAAQREIALVALRASVPTEVSDKIVAILARSDENPNVRAQAIEELGHSAAVSAAKTLAYITHDASRTTAERSLAASSSIQVAVRQAANLTSPTGATLLLASTGAADLAIDASPFTEALIRGMGGDADGNNDGSVSGSELGRYVAIEVSVKMQRFGIRQQPIWVTKGSDDLIIGPPAALNGRYRRVVALLIGLSTNSVGVELRGARADLLRFADVLKRGGAYTAVLTGSAATKVAVQSAFADASAKSSSEDLFIFYLSGYAASSPQGPVHWPLAGSPADVLTAGDINNALDKIRANNKAVFVDSCYAGAIAQ